MGQKQTQKSQGINESKWICTHAIVKRIRHHLPECQQATFRRRTLSPGVSHTFRDPGGIFICHRSGKQPRPLLPLFAGREHAKIGICCRLQIRVEVEKPNLIFAGGLGGRSIVLIEGGRKKKNKTKRGRLSTTALIPTGASSSHR